ncbi:Arginase [Purpureocillium takamizusanense]|uniref:Arginase n=1 Tax=Purpureocillium takamizusanense TaxID=2060973 RepID=A0A9Q8V533_9HYPO|nr:Arginase [Purpureocillium takamizusanense]UNI13295.1 Arginase [Purpureocillium takamizusanense]
MRGPVIRSLSVIVSPFHVGIRGSKTGAGPLFLQQHGLIPALEELGLPVRRVEVEPVDETDDELARSFEVLRRTARLVAQERRRSSFPVVLSGDCTGAVGVAAGLVASGAVADGGAVDGSRLGCVWFDAHDDIHTPDTLASGYGDSMPISLLAGRCYQRLLQTVPGHHPLNLDNLIHVGMRDVTDEERARVVEAGFDVIWGDAETKADFRDKLGQALQRKRLGQTMVHLDLDSLDLSLGKANKFGTAGGLLEEDILGCLDEVASQTKPVSLTIASFDPSYEGADNIARVAIQAVQSFIGSLSKAE